MDNKPSKKRTILLVLRSQTGDRDAMDRLLEVCQSELLGYLSKMLNNQSDAEDVLQTTLLQAVKKLKWLREPAFFRSWIFRIASRNAYEVIRHSRRRKEFSNSEFIDAEPQKEFDHSAQQNLIEQIPSWLEKLTPKGREAVILHYLKGFTSEEVAEILGIPLATAKSRISYSLACIRKQINNKQE